MNFNHYELRDRISMPNFANNLLRLSMPVKLDQKPICPECLTEMQQIDETVVQTENSDIGACSKTISEKYWCPNCGEEKTIEIK